MRLAEVVGDLSPPKGELHLRKIIADDVCAVKKASVIRDDHDCLTFNSLRVIFPAQQLHVSIHVRESAMRSALLRRESNMITRLLGAAAVALIVLAAMPASAARLQGCSGGNLEKAESAVEVMADGDAKWVAYKEMTDAQTALLDGKMNVCAVHLTKAMQLGMTK